MRNRAEQYDLKITGAHKLYLNKKNKFFFDFSDDVIIINTNSEQVRRQNSTPPCRTSQSKDTAAQLWNHQCSKSHSTTLRMAQSKSLLNSLLRFTLSNKSTAHRLATERWIERLGLVLLIFLLHIAHASLNQKWNWNSFISKKCACSHNLSSAVYAN